MCKENQKDNVEKEIRTSEFAPEDFVYFLLKFTKYPVTLDFAYELLKIYDDMEDCRRFLAEFDEIPGEASVGYVDEGAYELAYIEVGDSFYVIVPILANLMQSFLKKHTHTED